MTSDLTVKWIAQRGYSIEAQLFSDGLSFEAFDIISKAAGKDEAAKVKKKIIGRLAKNLRADCQDEHDVDISLINYGVYCIAVGTGFEIDYKNRKSRIVYIGSGAPYNRIRSHLSGKLFEFSGALRSVPLRFYIADLTNHKQGKTLQRVLEQKLLARFQAEIDSEFPLLNARNAKASDTEEISFNKGWDYPIQKDRSKNTTDWLIKPLDEARWKGAFKS